MDIRQSVNDVEQESYFIERDGIRFSGVHLLIDMWGGNGLNDLEVVERILRRAVEACGATLLNIELHRFEPNDGITGVATLSESHLSIHSWPEERYAAIDIFTCGTSWASPGKTDALEWGRRVPGKESPSAGTNAALPA